MNWNIFWSFSTEMTIRGIKWMEGILALHLTAAIETKDIIGRLSQHEQSVEKAL